MCLYEAFGNVQSQPSATKLPGCTHVTLQFHAHFTCKDQAIHTASQDRTEHHGQHQSSHHGQNQHLHHGQKQSAWYQGLEHDSAVPF